jgi:hypothetical protein
MSQLVPLILLVAVVIVHAYLAVNALADLNLPGRRVRLYPPQTWRVLILIAAIVGPLAYFSIGREPG